MFRRKEEVDKRIQTASEFINIKDIKGSVLYTLDNHIFSYIKLQPISIDLLSDSEKRILINTLTAELSSETKPFKFFAISQVVDMSKLKNQLYNVLNTTSDNIRRRLINEEITQIAGFALSGEIIERQFFVIVWERLTEDGELVLKRRATELAYKFQSCGVNADLLNQNRIYHLAKLFAHPQSGHLDSDDNEFSATIPIIGGLK
jgi:dimeric dUTPase (all-alpha-NTP-PPase superfamily)